MLGLLLAEQLVPATYSFALIFMRQRTSRVCTPRPHDLEQSVQEVTCQLKEIKGVAGVITILSMHDKGGGEGGGRGAEAGW